MMKKLILSIGGATMVGLVMAAGAMAAGPTSSPGPANGNGAGAGTVIPSIVGLTQAQVQELRQSGKSLAQIAEQQKVDPQKLVDALEARWTERIDARVAAGALTASEATALKAQVELRARDMVNKTTLGGMQGAAVGAGNGAGNGMGNGMGRHGAGAGNGTCAGTAQP
jgi:hypothetical protein